MYSLFLSSPVLNFLFYNSLMQEQGFLWSKGRGLLRNEEGVRFTNKHLGPLSLDQGKRKSSIYCEVSLFISQVCIKASLKKQWSRGNGMTQSGCAWFIALSIPCHFLFSWQLGNHTGWAGHWWFFWEAISRLNDTDRCPCNSKYTSFTHVLTYVILIHKILLKRKKRLHFSRCCLHGNTKNFSV